MEIAAREMRLRHGDYIVVPSSTWRLPHVGGRYFSDKEKKLAMHAGHGETAIMLALAPETVHMERAVTNYPPEFPSKLLSPDGRPACAWTARDFGPSGIIGDPLPATKEQGEAILDSLADSWAQAITELHELRWPARGRGHLGQGQHTGHIERRPRLSRIRIFPSHGACMNIRPLTRALVGACVLVAAAPAFADEKFIYMTNWFAEAEHGGFYQAIATGLYKKYGLDVTMKMGGPQVNIIQLMAAGQADCIMGSSDLQIDADARGRPADRVRRGVFPEGPAGADRPRRREVVRGHEDQDDPHRRGRATRLLAMAEGRSTA